MQPPGSGKFLNREALIRNVAAERKSETHFLLLLVNHQSYRFTHTLKPPIKIHHIQTRISSRAPSYLKSRLLGSVTRVYVWRALLPALCLGGLGRPETGLTAKSVFSASKTLIWRFWKRGFELETFGFPVGDWAAGGLAAFQNGQIGFFGSRR